MTFLAPETTKSIHSDQGLFSNWPRRYCALASALSADRTRRVGACPDPGIFRRRVRCHNSVKIFFPPVQTIRNSSLNRMEWRVRLKYERVGSNGRLNVYVLFSLSSAPESISVPRVIVHAFQSLGFCLISVIQVSNSFNFVLAFKLIYMQFACQSFFF